VGVFVRYNHRRKCTRNVRYGGDQGRRMQPPLVGRIAPRMPRCVYVVSKRRRRRRSVTHTAAPLPSCSRPRRPHTGRHRCPAAVRLPSAMTRPGAWRHVADSCYRLSTARARAHVITTFAALYSVHGAILRFSLQFRFRRLSERLSVITSRLVSTRPPSLFAFISVIIIIRYFVSQNRPSRFIWISFVINLKKKKLYIFNNVPANRGRLVVSSRVT